ncbi:MAG: alpha/beta hydrolase [Candidatus Roizmanbacteria bacterium]|nr:alpha/beta hydrolase [Candidatus Roizmanbacteria bacterium]
MVFFGHSLSPVFVLHLAEQFDLQLKGAIFASPFLESLNQEKTWQFDIVNGTFYKTAFNWDKLKKLIPLSYVLYGTDDPYVPNKFPIDFANRLGSEIIPVKNGGHLGGNFTEFPLLLELFKKMQG